MKKIVLRPYTPVLTLLVGLLTGLGIVGYWAADYPQTLADTVLYNLPSGESILRWLITI